MQAHDGGGTFGGHVLDRLRLVEHDGVPPFLRERLRVALQQAVGRQHDVERFERGENLFAAGAAVVDDVQRRRETRRLLDPVAADRRGRGHERRAALGAVQQQRQRLHGFAQPHVVGQTGARAPVGEARQPAEAFQLIGAQLRAQRARCFRRESLRFVKALAQLLPFFVGGQSAFVEQFRHGRCGRRRHA